MRPFVFSGIVHYCLLVIDIRHGGLSWQTLGQVRSQHHGRREDKWAWGLSSPQMPQIAPKHE